MKNERELLDAGFRITVDKIENVYRGIVSWPERGRTSPPITGPYAEVWSKIFDWANAQRTEEQSA